MSISIGKSTIVSDGLVLLLDPSHSDNYTLSQVEVLVVAGGGGGGTNGTGNDIAGGGGGAGGLIYNNSYAVTPSSAITVTVGNGGATAQNTIPTASQNSVFGYLTAIGGGRGGGYAGGAYFSGTSGGSGGGGIYSQNSGYDGTTGQGNKGGRGTSSANPGAYAAGGGGGAGQAGENTNLKGKGGDGGDGLPFSISGSLVYYAGGGGGGTGSQNQSYRLAGKGGRGGGGAGSDVANGRPGVPNTGGGGGGAGNAGGSPYSNGFGGAGGSGIVIVRYPGPQKATGGNTITQVGGYTIHTFTSSGTFTPLAVPVNAGAVYGLQDLSGNNTTGTQSGGVTYNTANGGSLVFDGTNDIITITSTGIVTNNISVDIWFNVNTAKAYAALLGSNVTEKYEMLIKTASNLEISLAPGNYIQHNNILSINTWTNIVVSASNGVAWKVYKNGVDLGTPPVIVGTYQINGTGVSNIDQGRIRTDVGSFAFSGNIATTKIYNRALTAAEILQNFNAQRGRFGI